MHGQSIAPDKIAIYVRWSTDDQTDNSSLSVQLEGCKHYILSQGWQVRDDLVFVDDGYSGGNIHRPALTAMRKLIDEGKIDCVVVFKLDRLSRSVVDTVNLVLHEWEGITFLKSAREPIDSTSAMGKQFFYLLVSFAELERSLIKDRTSSGRLDNAKHGKIAGNPPAYGYQVGSVPGIFELEPNEAPIVVRIFEEYIKGKGMQKISHGLNNDGIQTKRNRGWNASTIHRMLQNPIYMGKLVYGRTSRSYDKRDNTRTTIIHDNPLVDTDSLIIPIISQEMFGQVQNLLVDRSVKGTSPSGRSLGSEMLLAGLVKCTCGYSLVARRKHKQPTHAIQLKCSSARMKGNSHCDAGYVNMPLLEKVVMDDIRKLFFSEATDDGVLSLLSEGFTRSINRILETIQSTESTIKSLSNQITRVDRDYRSGEITSSVYNKLMSQIDTEHTAMNNRLQELQDELLQIESKRISNQDIATTQEALEVWDMIPIERRKQIIYKWIDSIVAYKKAGTSDLVAHIRYRWEE